jgi:hypothetical protein
MMKQRRNAVSGVAVIGSTVGGILVAAGGSGVTATIALAALIVFFLLALTLLVCEARQDQRLTSPPVSAASSPRSGAPSQSPGTVTAKAPAAIAVASRAPASAPSSRSAR